MPAEPTPVTRELDSRSDDGVHVRMPWSEHDGCVDPASGPEQAFRPERLAA